jgi:hypothetical protein
MPRDAEKNPRRVFAAKVAWAKRRMAAINPRRCELIEKKIGSGLGDDERAELDRLQRRAREVTAFMAPPPDPRVEELLRQYGKGGASDAP